MTQIKLPKVFDVKTEAPALSFRTHLDCHGNYHTIIFAGEIEKAFVKDDSETAKTYVFWFREGGTIELVIEHGCLRLWDSYGVDVSYGGSAMHLAPHRPGGPRGRFETALATYSG